MLGFVHEDCPKFVSCRKMTRFPSPYVLELPVRQEDVPHCLMAFLTVVCRIRNVGRFLAEEEVTEFYFLGPQLHRNCALPFGQPLMVL